MRGEGRPLNCEMCDRNTHHDHDWARVFPPRLIFVGRRPELLALAAVCNRCHGVLEREGPTWVGFRRFSLPAPV